MPPAPSLTDIAIRNAVPRNQQYEIWDGKLPGFAIRVSPQGAKSFVVLYRHKGRARRLTLGRYPILSLSDGRRMATAALRDVAMGDDPAAKKLEAKQEGSFRGLVVAYIENHAKRNTRSWSETARLLEREFVQQWGSRAVQDVTKRDVLEVVDAIAERGHPSAANHAFAAVRGLFNWAVERGLLDRSPCDRLKPPAKVKSRDRVLNWHELNLIWRAARTIGYPFGPLVQLLLLTGQRRDEIGAMEWQEIDLAQKFWTIPAARTKNGRSHAIPLSLKAVGLISGLPRLSDRLVFPARGRTDRPFSGYSTAKNKLDSLAKVQDWRLHDLRRTFSTEMARMKVRLEVVERMLNHTSGSFAGVVGTYNRYEYIDEMRAAVDAWGTIITGFEQS